MQILLSVWINIVSKFCQQNFNHFIWSSLVNFCLHQPSDPRSRRGRGRGDGRRDGRDEHFRYGNSLI